MATLCDGLLLLSSAMLALSRRLQLQVASLTNGSVCFVHRAGCAHTLHPTLSARSQGGTTPEIELLRRSYLRCLMAMPPAAGGTRHGRPWPLAPPSPPCCGDAAAFLRQRPLTVLTAALYTRAAHASAATAAAAPKAAVRLADCGAGAGAVDGVRAEPAPARAYIGQTMEMTAWDEAHIPRFISDWACCMPSRLWRFDCMNQDSGCAPAAVAPPAAVELSGAGAGARAGAASGASSAVDEQQGSEQRQLKLVRGTRDVFSLASCGCCAATGDPRQQPWTWPGVKAVGPGWWSTLLCTCHDQHAASSHRQSCCRRSRCHLALNLGFRATAAGHLWHVLCTTPHEVPACIHHPGTLTWGGSRRCAWGGDGGQLCRRGRLQVRRQEETALWWRTGQPVSR